MNYWIWVCCGCAASAAGGFSFMRFAVSKLPNQAVGAESIAVWNEVPEVMRMVEPAAAGATAVRERPVAPRSRPERPLPEGSAPEVRTAPRERVTPATTAAGKPAPTAAAKPRKAAKRAPAPTAPEPQAAKLARWARQIEAGERTMSIATDGCRVTWNRTCKHGHPSWLVRLGYLKRTPGAKFKPH
jgi:hypothetical protein